MNRTNIYPTISLYHTAPKNAIPFPRNSPSKCAYELSEYDRLFAKIREIIPEGKVPSPELLRKQLEKIQEQYNEQSAKYDTSKKEADRLAQQIQKKQQSQKTLDRYLQNEQAAKRKKGQLE